MVNDSEINICGVKKSKIRHKYGYCTVQRESCSKLNDRKTLVDIHFIYDLANGNGHASVPLYGDGYLTRWQPNRQTFARVHQNQAEHGVFRAMIDDTPVNSEMNLVARISNAAATICERHGFSIMSANPCRVGVVRAYVQMAAISNTFCDVLTSYF
ncbi:hypothetical protein TNCV_415311 [Trichonephila clavipes]|nr:hypothetical protein TNCV_415311 [Trichonephila clavipes]